MGSVGDAYDNAMAESFISTLECELLSRRSFSSQAEARMACFTYIEAFYNRSSQRTSRYVIEVNKVCWSGPVPWGVFGTAWPVAPDFGRQSCRERHG